MIKRTLLAASILVACSGAFADKDKSVTLEVLGTYESGIFDDSAAEIVAHDPVNQRLFVINAADSVVDVLDISNPTDPTHDFEIDVTTDLTDAGGINSVAVHDGVVAVAVERDNKQLNGWVAFYDTDGNFLKSVPAGALPDMLTFTPNGKYVLAANEGEPNDTYMVDPVGSVTVIDISGGVMNATAMQAGFDGFDDAAADAAGVRTPQPYDASVAQDLEPEYIAVSRDSKTAWVAMQENNGLAVVDIKSATVTGLVGLGCKDHMLAGNGLDPSNRDEDVDNGPLKDGININTWPVCGLYMPDAITAYRSRGSTWLITANEGDGRDYGFDAGGNDGKCSKVNGDWYLDDDDCVTYRDEARIKDASLDLPGYTPGELQEDENLGRLKFVTTEGNTDADAAYEALYSFGARSFTIWDTAGNVIYDSGDDFEQKTAAMIPDDFNSTNDENDSFDDRSDDKGPEPEGVVTGKVRGEVYAFIGLERVGGIMVYNVTDPTDVRFSSYVNNRDFDEADAEYAGDLGPEGLAFIKAADSPNGKPILAVGNEVSGTTTLFQVVSQ